MDYDVKLKLDELIDGERVDSKRFRELIGSLLYFAIDTRPGICISICELYQYLEAPTQTHTKGAPLSQSNLKDKTIPRSKSGVLVLMTGAPSIYKSKYQKTVALSSAEKTLAPSSSDELDFRDQPVTVIKMDNKAAIAIAERVGYQSLAKHIDLRYHFVRGAVNDGVLSLE
ncbi:hypothetical protein PsorP6_016532 [Peronosclerospora sorghi]|uniref:Uncharacterized protein n=1 Tax=Peronosclerospora sorghi TaxID=230839 RepID=A0ACC0VNI0_9STRA|nr:hypothetical protein PsorP6_016532 [Peronosclerospora sorghi]